MGDPHLSHANGKKLMQVIDEMLQRNGGWHYTPKRLKKRAKTSQCSQAIASTSPSSSSPGYFGCVTRGHSKVTKALTEDADGAVTGSIAGAAPLGATLKMATFVLDQVGTSMTGYTSLLAMPYVILQSLSETRNTFSLSLISGGFVSGFFLVMTILGALQGIFTGGLATANAQTFKEAARIGAKAVLEKVNKNVKDSLQVLLQQVCGGSENFVIK